MPNKQKKFFTAIIPGSISDEAVAEVLARDFEDARHRITETLQEENASRFIDWLNAGSLVRETGGSVSLDVKAHNPRVHIAANKLIAVLRELSTLGLQVTEFFFDENGKEVELRDVETGVKKWVQLGR